ncbi:uncharacterized protein LOC126776375 [Nymphalis io]|uniref:uncharacterized protein LOC126776375 n=1 Tax=Inachis io TaxID=171585 RepID=UPI002169EE78|nr:uncharacterized protein LOC126776375 [Nymphalis io]
MWKYVTRRFRDTFERSANHFDKRSSAVINPPNNNLTEDKNKNSPCCFFISKKCWNSFQSENDTNSNRWNFEQLNRTWIGAITWSSALVFGWYTSQLIHLKFKKQSNDKTQSIPRNNGILELSPIFNTFSKKTLNPLDLTVQLNKSVDPIQPTVHFISNEHIEQNDKGRSSSSGSNITGTLETSDNDLGEVLNSIENRLGLAAIENGQPQDGLNLLRSAANRNHAPAIYNLALCYELGLGVDVNEKIAMEYYRSAAALQHPGALYNLGIYYGQGRGGLSRDDVTAIRLLRLAAVQGQQDAITALKSLKEDSSDIDISPENNLSSWSKQFSQLTKHSNIIPTHSALFVENVDLLQKNNYIYEPIVY